METLVFSLFEKLFKALGILIIAGVVISVLTDIQAKAFGSKKVGLVSMLQINQQLVGKTKGN